ncbi:tRNA (adenosine(37)-N6)-threonylcarbamoyltransferase complex transferase subunit TsaD [Atopobacter sp. AH10]|uniref:tRNA (adenosine(37)-N6)-threonylcarbamoyltransferase complex transferase subunit TsaD n=1 Tax=Atopobacter sp. AH10 TaxID=2315861 RepID=UPI000EF1D8EB|nr:tRNA (adenosine(37)-N6)-threonylcarbamoyltransferase complex transferase subunit TsaD [Atopobacter sp. AH10]RLK63117.1 tRNA (adenosine(37)-N6)-threonylcarbamoyltransferase complex transferase subunit TsaD [Atopobacter sp. AH10]
MTTILAIESSCDETSAAIVRNGRELLSNIVASQVPSHQRFGGVVPEVASRHHIACINPVIAMALEEANLHLEDIDAVAVTAGPGLVGALLIGVSAAKAIAYSQGIPLIAVNHMAGHIYANHLETPLEFPLMALVVSGGHTELVRMTDHVTFEVIGETRDDAVGEAYDKIGRVLGLPYPAGKAMDQLAHQGEDKYAFPRAMMEEDNYDFSFSGLKSAVINTLHHADQLGEEIIKEDVATSFQAAVVDILATKTLRALKEYPSKQLILAGGVAANRGLRERLEKELKGSVQFLRPPMKLCGDNAAMIAACAYYQYLKGDFADSRLNAFPGWAIDQALPSIH